MAMSLNSPRLEQPTAAPFPTPVTARAGGRTWRLAIALAARLVCRTFAACRRVDTDQARLLDVAAERDNVHLLFPRVF